LRQALNALSAEAGLPSQQAVEAGETEALEAGRNLLATPELRCTECHKFREHEDEPSGPDLTGYGSETWLVAFISDPAQPRFYGNRNDRMPAFGRDGILGSQEIRLLAAWLRGDYVAAARP
jgi:ubiquinol-cytochrome c reductase cytochrome b subunit